MPNGNRRARRPLPPARAKAIKKIKKIKAYHKEREIHAETMRKSFAPTGEGPEYEAMRVFHEEKVNKANTLMKKVRAGARAPRKVRITIRELIPRARPWTERIANNRNFMSQLAPEELHAVNKINAGKKVNRAEMNSIIDVVREFRGVILGEEEILRQRKHI